MSFNVLSHSFCCAFPFLPCSHQYSASHYSIRAMCGLDSEKNCVHGSDSLQSAVREISFFFGDVKSGWFLLFCFISFEDGTLNFLTLI